MVDIEWRNERCPVSLVFDDVYFSLEDGRAETRYVFLSGNHLPQRFLGRDRFTIAELGFGTGLNLLETLKLREETGSRNLHLHYIGFEKYPLDLEQMLRAHAVWPELDSFSQIILEHYTQALESQGPVEIPKLNLSLDLIIGDVSETIFGGNFSADAWFLDGFAPAKNPDMWAEPILIEVGRKTAEGGTFATFTAAGIVRKAMTAAGFEVEKIKGFGRKRHMIKGSKPNSF